MKYGSKIILILSFLILTPALAACDEGQPESTLDSYAGSFFAEDEPGGTVLVMKDGEVLLQEGYGLANLETDTLNGPETVFRLGSVSKPFTAAGILLLVQDGLVALDDPLGKFFEDLEGPVATVTIEHLLTHTSGIPDFIGNPDWVALAQRQSSREEVIAIVTAPPLHFEPGTQGSYSNAGYYILSHILELVSGEDFGAFIEGRVFRPLEMNNSWFEDGRRVIPNRAHGYGKDGEKFVNPVYINLSSVLGAGALVSSTQDLQLWFKEMKDGSLISKELWARAVSSTELPDGSLYQYGYGWKQREVVGFPTIQHDGSVNGFESTILYVPDEEVFVAVLTNQSLFGHNSTTVTQKLAALVLGKPFPAFERVSMSEDAMMALEGEYDTASGGRYQVIVDSGRLMINRGESYWLEAIPAGNNQFFHEDSLGYFSKTPEGLTYVKSDQSVDQAIFKSKKLSGEREIATVDSQVLESLVGTYELVLGGAEITISREGDKMFAALTGVPRAQLYALDDYHHFIRISGAELVFTPGEDGVNKAEWRGWGQVLEAVRK